MIDKFKIAAGDVISIRGQVMENTYIPTGNKRELGRFGVDTEGSWGDLMWIATGRGKLSGLLEEDWWPF